MLLERVVPIEKFLYKYISVSTMDEFYFQGRKVWISVHAVKRARQREIIYPDMVYATINGGRIKRFGKNMIKFIKRYKRGTVICVGEIVGDSVIIKTVEWGN